MAPEVLYPLCKNSFCPLPPTPNIYFLFVGTWLWVPLQSLSIVSSRLIHVRTCVRVCFTHRYSIGVIVWLANGLCLLATADNAAVNVCANACVNPCSQISQASTQRQNHCLYSYSVFQGAAGVLLHSLTLMGLQHESSLPLPCVLF